MIGCAAYNFRPVWDGATVTRPELARRYKGQGMAARCSDRGREIQKILTAAPDIIINVNR